MAALPAALLQLCEMIDSPWILAMERSDEAGKRLAVSLLETAGQRPITLVGYSLGARVIYSCLTELARHQKLWEDQQQRLERSSTSWPDVPKPNKENDSSKFGNNQIKEETERNSFNLMCYNFEPASIVEDVVLMGW